MATFSSPTLIVILCLLLSVFRTCSSIDTLALSQSLSDGMTIDSKNGNFQLGFFSPKKSNNRYLGIWYKNITVQTVVWVANREAPIKNFSALFQISSTTGDVLLVTKNNIVLWSAVPYRIVQNSVLQLLDTGNLVLREYNDSNPDNYLWQSFDYPSDTGLSMMKFCKNFRTGMDRKLTAWKSPDDPSPGNLSMSFVTLSLYIDHFPESVLWLGPNIHFRTGPYNGREFSGRPDDWSHLVKRIIIDDHNESCIVYNFTRPILMRRVLNETTLALEIYSWSQSLNTWMLFGKFPKDDCDVYGHCGPNGICDSYKSPLACQCLNGFKPKSPGKWKAMKYSEGCVRDSALICQKDEFLKLQGVKVPVTTFSWLDRNMNLKECREKCLTNCSCMAFGNSDIRRGGSGCIIWFSDLIDIRVEPDGGQDLYIRTPASVSDKSHTQKVKLAEIVGFTVTAICVMLIIVFYGIMRIRGNARAIYIFRPTLIQTLAENGTILETTANEGGGNDLDLPLFELPKITHATGNFSLDNKLGQGGFGTVYRGTLRGGQKIAVKRLSRSSTQGIDELKNEARLIATLQHRNLVKLLGFCVQDEERMLIYEFMPNRSLDLFLFDEARGEMLDWSKRFHIINGIAKGLLYLHEDSRLRIVHRDLKASNILLDSEMNPKISDFGLARCFVGEEDSRNTNRVVGTHGYMAPEYAINGRFSVQSDVFSFGVLVLEIVTGKKSRGFYGPTNNLNLIAHVWDLWKEGKFIELVDERIVGNYCNISEAVRCIHISLSCLQLNPDDRPTMSSVLLILDGKSTFPEPKEPGFFIGESSDDGEFVHHRPMDKCQYNGGSVTEAH